MRSLCFSSIIAVAVCVVACTGGGTGSDTEDTQLIRAALPPDITVELLFGGAADEQVALFRDGTVDFADYEHAILEYMRCLQGEGATILSWPVYDDSRRRFAYSVQGVGDMTEWARKAALCFTEQAAYVHATWQWQHKATESERQSAAAALGACLRDAGFTEILNEATSEQLSQLIEDASTSTAATACLGEVIRTTGVYPVH